MGKKIHNSIHAYFKRINVQDSEVTLNPLFQKNAIVLDSESL